MASTTPTAPTTPAQDEDRVVLWPEVHELIPLSRVSIWSLRRKGDFPAPIKLSPNRVGWRLSDVRAWIASRERV